MRNFALNIVRHKILAFLFLFFLFAPLSTFAQVSNESLEKDFRLDYFKYPIKIFLGKEEKAQAAELNMNDLGSPQTAANKVIKAIGADSQFAPKRLNETLKTQVEQPLKDEAIRQLNSQKEKAKTKVWNMLKEAFQKIFAGMVEGIRKIFSGKP